MGRASKSDPPAKSAPAAEWVRVAELKPWKRNPKPHADPAAIDALAREILETAFGAPLQRQRSSGRLTAGHKRRLAVLRILAGFRVEVQGELRGGPEWAIAGSPGPGYVPVRTLDVDDATADRMALADNAPGLVDPIDEGALLAVLGDARQMGTDALANLGWSDAVIDGLLEGAAVACAGTVPPEEAFGALPSDEKPPFQALTFTLHDEQAEVVREALAKAKGAGPFTGPNENSNGNALARIAEAYLG